MGPSQSEFFIRVPNPILTFTPFEPEDSLMDLQNLVTDTLLCSSHVISCHFNRLDCITEESFSPWDFGWPAGIIKLLDNLGNRLARVHECGEQMEISQVEIKIYFLRVYFKKITQINYYSENERKKEAVSALLVCREIFSIFSNKDFIFWKQPLMAAPILVSFAAVYRSFSAIMSKLMPSEFEREEKEQMEKFKKVLLQYKRRSIEERLQNVILLQNVTKSYVMKFAAWDASKTVINTHMRFAFIDIYDKRCFTDTKVKRKRLYRWSDNIKYIQQYKDILTLKYNHFFNMSLNEFIPHLV